MTIQNLSDAVLLSQTKALVREETRLTTEILHHLREIEARKIFCALGFSSLFEYATRELAYSESAAQLRIDSMRLLRELPHVDKQIQKGELTLSVLTQAQKHFRQEAKLGRPQTREQKEAVVQSLLGKSSREAERALFAMSPESEKHRPEIVRPVSATHAELRFLADQDLQRDLEKLKGLLAHTFPNMSLADLVKYMAEQTFKRLDPARQEAKKVQGVREKRSVGTSEVKAGQRQAIPAATRRAVWKRDGSRCTYTHQGKRCNSSYRLEIDHVRPVAFSGSNEMANLRLLCANHNAHEAARVYGREKIQAFWQTHPGDCA